MDWINNGRSGLDTFPDDPDDVYAESDFRGDHFDKAFYMPALVTCRFNPDLSVRYGQLETAGKPPRVAITAIMRKLIVLG